MSMTGYESQWSGGEDCETLVASLKPVKLKCRKKGGGRFQQFNAENVFSFRQLKFCLLFFFSKGTWMIVISIFISFRYVYISIFLVITDPVLLLSINSEAWLFWYVIIAALWIMIIVIVSIECITVFLAQHTQRWYRAYSARTTYRLSEALKINMYYYYLWQRIVFVRSFWCYSHGERHAGYFTFMITNIRFYKCNFIRSGATWANQQM